LLHNVEKANVFKDEQDILRVGSQKQVLEIDVVTLDLKHVVQTPYSIHAERHKHCEEYRHNQS
jgi:hypothetical protein